MSQVKIELLIANGDDVYPDVTLVRVIKLITYEGGNVSRFGLSFATGEWIGIKEGEQYPKECTLENYIALRGNRCLTYNRD